MEVKYRLSKKKSHEINELSDKKKVLFNRKIDLQSQNVDISW